MFLKVVSTIEKSNDPLTTPKKKSTRSQSFSSTATPKHKKRTQRSNSLSISPLTPKSKTQVKKFSKMTALVSGYTNITPEKKQKKDSSDIK
ncbi:hypothetical protein ACFLZV_04810 [Candidatus Margulisiibacteriota bacterium]